MKKILFAVVLVVVVLGMTIGGSALVLQNIDTSFVSPIATSYAVGEKLNLRGGSITIGGEETALTAEMLDTASIPTFDQPGTYTITGSYKGITFSYDVEVYEGVEFKSDESVTTLTPAYDFSQLISVRQIDREGQTSEWYPLSKKDISSVEVKDGKVYATAEVTMNGITREKTYSYDVDESGISVEDLKKGTVGQTYVVKGVVVAIGTTVTQDEVVIADKATGEMICIYNLISGGKVTLQTVEVDFAIGDEIVIPVVLKKSLTKASDNNETADRGKLVAEYVGCKQVSAGVLSHNNQVAFDYSQVEEINTNAEFKTYLAKANRANVVYKIVKLKGSLDFVYYGDSRQIKFCFSDLKPSSLTSFRIDGTKATPVFCDGAVRYTTGKSFSELVFGDPNFFTGSTSDSLANKATREVEIYALYIGGNQWYHQFIPLQTTDVTVITK